MDTIKMDSLKEGDTLQIGDALYIASNFIEDDMIKAWKLTPVESISKEEFEKRYPEALKCSLCGETLRYLGTSGLYTCDNPNCPDPINQQAQQIIARRKLEEKLPE